MSEPAGIADNVRALVFDVFGTVVDWRGSIIREGERVWRARGIETDWGRLADRWRRTYPQQMDRVRSGALPWTKLDTLHRMGLDEVLRKLELDHIDAATREELNLVWHRLDPWPDSAPGLTRLRSKFVIAPLSNGNVSLMVDMARHGGLPWDTVLGAEVARHYKPDPETYLTAAELLSLKPERTMMVAAHAEDLDAAKALGFVTAFIPRPLEFGPEREARVRERADAARSRFDIVADGMEALATALGC